MGTPGRRDGRGIESSSRGAVACSLHCATPCGRCVDAHAGKTIWTSELRSHVEHRTADLARRGIAPAEAERRARFELGALESHKEECRRSYGLRWADETWQDLRYASRTLRRSPGFSAVAILSLALGIGANTAVFGVLDALILRPLPVKAPAASSSSNLRLTRIRPIAICATAM